MRKSNTRPTRTAVTMSGIKDICSRGDDDWQVCDVDIAAAAAIDELLETSYAHAQRKSVTNL